MGRLRGGRGSLGMNKQDSIRLKNLTKEFAKGFEALKNVKKGIVVFGSARAGPNNFYYKKAEELSHKLTKKGFSMITGAGKGIMEAVNKGAYNAGGLSVGLNIKLPKVQERNKYVNHYIKFTHFYARKVMFCKYSFATIIFPGGYGTLDELFDLLAILQNQKINPRPLILVGKKYYQGLYNWLINRVTAENKISVKDLSLFRIIDDIDEIVEVVEEEYDSRSRKFFI